MLGDKMLIVRWNGALLPSGRNSNSALTLRARDPMTGTYLDLTLQAHEPKTVEELWARAPDFRSRSRTGEENTEPGTISYWYSTEMPEIKELNDQGLEDANLAESLRQIVKGEFTEEIRSLVTIRPGPRRNMSMPFALERYRPFLKRVIEEETRFLNRPEVITACEETLVYIKERE